MNPKRVIKYNPLLYQEQFHESTKPNDYLSAGFGGGKTYSLIMKMLQLAEWNVGIPGGILAPTLMMYRRDVVPTIEEICDQNQIRAIPNRSSGQWNFPDTGTQVYVFHSEDDGSSIRGPNLGWGIINEVTLVTERAFKMFRGRIRIKAAKVPQIAMSGTPEGFNWAYEYFIEHPRADTDLFFGDATLNTYVGEYYFDQLRESYDPLMQKAYIQGQFINLVGKRVAWVFDRFKHTDCQKSVQVEKIPGAQVYVSLDFNVSPLAATLWNFIEPKDEGRRENQVPKVRAFDEICIDGADTFDFCNQLKTRLSPDDHVTIFPDPAGRARTTKSNRTDFDILRLEGFTNLKYKGQISVKDCLNSMNNALSKGMVEINYKKCPNLVADLEQCVFKSNQFEIDKSNTRRSHWIDGFKNMCDMIWPIKRPSFREERAR